MFILLFMLMHRLNNLCVIQRQSGLSQVRHNKIKNIKKKHFVSMFNRIIGCFIYRTLLNIFLGIKIPVLIIIYYSMPLDS